MSAKSPKPRDLIVFVSDKNILFTLKAALERPDSLGIRPISFDFRTHPGRDGGMRTTGVASVAVERARFQHALLMFDHEGCGEMETSATELEARLDYGLRLVWSTNAKTIVIDPEVDVWMWGADNALRQAIGWPHTGSIRNWIDQRDYQLSTSGKPLRPKEALEAVLKECRLPRSSAVYKSIASRLSLSRCEDAAFQRLKAQLQAWFPKT
jgi:hypothetical protein